MPKIPCTPAPGALRRLRRCAIAPLCLLAGAAYSAEIAPEAPPASVVVSGSLIAIGVADSANQGIVSAKQIESRPLLRTGELLEAVPGVIVTQHSGDGKANQYFARGFNLDHGTDFRTSVMGMPVNLPTNAHGQGYSDLNFLIPELVSTIQYKKGTYYAEEGDFSAAGSASFDYLRKLERGLFSVDIGQRDYRRALLADSVVLGPGSLLYALESITQNGPWSTPEQYRHGNGVLSYSWKQGDDALRLTAMALQASWNASDQVPQRAISSGLIDRYGSISPSDGGTTARNSLSLNWVRQYEDGNARLNAYVIRSRLDLFNDFTYALDDPIHGDQFEQSEYRLITGFNLERSWDHQLGRFASSTTLGVELRRDQLSPVGLYATEQRQRLSTTREDQVTEQAAAVFISNSTVWLPWLRTVLGWRADGYRFDDVSNKPANSGKVNAAMLSPKFSAILHPVNNAELYLNWGQGFHSNDARGVTSTVDPKTGLRTDVDHNLIVGATPLVKATGREVGLRLLGLVPGLQTTLSVWQLKLASELVFAGDSGATEAGRPSQRHGIEFSNFYVPFKDWIIDANLAWSQARFTDRDPVGPYIPGSSARTASLGLSGEQGPWSGGVRLRYFGPRALIEDDSVRSPSSTLVNLKLAYAVSRDWKLSLEVLNLMNRQVSDIDYYYVSRLAGEAAPVADIHTHPAEPRALRMGLAFRF